jgi:hypothetical protein
MTVGGAQLRLERGGVEVRRTAAFLARLFAVVALLGALFGHPAFAQGGGGDLERQRQEFLNRYVRYLSAEEARKWVASQGTSVLYLGEREMFPGLGASLKGKQVKVYASEGVRTIPWLDRVGVRYVLFQMPGRVLAESGVLIAPENYLLGPETDKEGRPTGRFTLVTYKEAANVIYRTLVVYEAFAKGVIRK